eukprot:13599621-Ditylum_brightwellii.AAC.1
MTGKFDQATEEWMEKPPTSKDYKERTAKQQGYHNANALMESATEEIAEVLDNLAMATTAVRRTIEEVQAMNNQLLELTKKMLDKIDKIREDMNTIKQHLEQLQYGNYSGDRGTSRCGKGGGCSYYGQSGCGYGGKSGKGKKEPNNEWLIGQIHIGQVNSIESVNPYCSLSPSMHSNTALANTRASNHYIREDALHEEDKSSPERISVGVPNSASMQSKHAYAIELGDAPKEGKTGHIIKGITTNLI